MGESRDIYEDMSTEILPPPRSQFKDSKLGLHQRIIRSPLSKAPTGIFTLQLTKLEAEQPYWRAITLLGQCQRRMNTSTNGLLGGYYSISICTLVRPYHPILLLRISTDILLVVDTDPIHTMDKD